MGVGGTKPKPTALKVIEGNPGGRPLNKNEPKPKLGTDCPEWLDDVARAEWDRVYPELERTGVITEVDRATLADYCAAWSLLVRAQEGLEHGEVIETSTGTLIQSPYVGMVNRASDRLRKLACELGMTPSSRSRVTTTKPTESKNPFKSFVKK